MIWRDYMRDAETMLHLLIEMEKTGLLGEGMFENLKMICRKIRPGLVEKIEDFEQIIRETPQRESCMEAAAVSISNLANCMEESTMSFAISNETLVSGMMEAVSMTSLSNRSEETTMSFAISSDEECSSPTACVSIDTVTQSGQHEATHLCMNQDSSVYEMKHKPRGYCLIFNNYNFEQARGNPELMNVKDRRGTEVDAAALQEVFTWLQFEVHQFNDLSAQEMQHVLSEFQKKDHTDRDCFICCILSHGGKGTVRATDGKMVNINTITSYFTGLKCRSLRGKPKVFFIQACQGENFQRAIAIEEDSNSPDALPVNPGNNSVESIPDEADFLLGMATMEHFVSYRIPTEGTWYIQSLCKNLKESCPRGEDILTILTNVNNEVSKKDDTRRNAKQMPQPKFTLRKKLIFPVH